MLKKILVGVIVLIGVVLIFGQKYFLNAESVDVVSNKVAIEARMEDRIKLVLASYLSTENIIATVRVNLLRSDEADAVVNEGGKKIRAWDASEEIILPGVPAANSMVKADKTKSESNKMRFGVASININLFIGKKLNDKASEKVKEIIVNMFGLDLDAGDMLTIESYEPIGKASDGKGISHLEIILIVFLLLLVYYLFGPLKHFMEVFNQNLLSRGSKSASGGFDGSSNEEFGLMSSSDESEKEVHATLLPSGIGGSAHMAGSIAGSIVGDEVNSLNKLINNETVEDLKLVLANEPGDVIAKVIAYLPSKYALAAIPNHRVTEVLAQYTNVASENPEELKNTISRIRARVEGSFGGAARLSKIVQFMDKSSQESILNMLRSKNMEFARNVEKRIFRFEDVLNYESQHLRRIFRKAGADTFANCLMSQTEAVVQKFYDKLGTSITALIANKLSVIVSSVRNIEAELEVFKAIENLSEKGLIPSIDQIKQSAVIAEQSQF